MREQNRRVVIVGGHEQACRMLEYLIDHSRVDVVLCIARKDDEARDGIFPSLLRHARKYNIPSLQPDEINADAVVKSVKCLEPDIVLSLQNNMIFENKWIDLLVDRLGIVNVHYAPLPKYAGYWPEMWAIWNGESQFAVTMHYIEKGIDVGPIIAQRWFDIDRHENRQTLYYKSADYAYAMLVDNLDKVLSEKIEATPQWEMDRTYFPKSLPNDGFLDLTWDSETQCRFIRAISFPGFPGPKIKINDRVYTILAEDCPFFVPTKTSYTQD